ncbi:cadherin-like beta sandwich domain-containing protein [uncultured Clostridium sp.]|uniref:cadherin-like beta sandwich domain-containing protein n=1 Tax=uncultured Clostridium sp. TaxID=59620 RepID=UPI0025F7253F|nr:cadherin-like beta sandwich domain-containing protein [uncultured Clostridium sp.]
MNKNIKHIITATLVISAFSAIVPAKNISNETGRVGFGLVQANASVNKNAGNGELKSLNLYRGSGSELELRKSYYGNEVDLSSSKDYYVELTGSEGIEINAEVKGDGYVVKIFDSAANDAKPHDSGDFIKVGTGTQNIYVRTYRSEDDFRDAYDDKKVSRCVNTYVIHVRKAEVVSDEELDSEDVYLKSIYLSDGTIDFNRNKTNYNVNVNEDVEQIVIRVKPNDNNHSVEIGDHSVTEDDDYEADVKLDKGDNIIKIKVEGDDDDITYTLNINRGKNSDSTSNAVSGDKNSSSLLVSNGKYNTWQTVNGKRQYIDGIGQPMKSKWFFDVNTGKSHYLNEDGFMVTGWNLDNNKWYYFDQSGDMKTGWQNINGKWYNLGKSGVMQTGWIQDSGKKWYYLDEEGVMQTGWVQISNGNWYYLNSNGEMLYSTTVDGYTLDKNGVMVK